MERYIDKLKQQDQLKIPRAQIAKEKREKIEAQNPCVVSSVTMGKELHAGHLFLLTIGEQMQSALGNRNPLILINNNTGPRAAAALCNIAKDQNLSLEEAASLMNNGIFDTPTIVQAYRSRKEDAPNLTEAIAVLSANEYNIFARVSEETKALLTNAGFSVQIVSESSLLEQAVNKTSTLVPEWAGTGFMPFNDNNRTVVIQKGGGLTATGTLFTSISAISEITKSDLILTVDSMPVVADVSFVYSLTSDLGISTQLPGAGVGFEGEIASGTKGEALPIREISKLFFAKRPLENLKQASLFLTLTRPLSLPRTNSSNLAESFYDFKDNRSLINLLIKCNDEVFEYKQKLQIEIKNLQDKIAGNSSTTSNSASKLLEFLPQRSQALFKTDLGRILSASKKVDLISANEEVVNYSQELGYDTDQNNPYLSSKRNLGIRKNFYFNFLNSLLDTIQGIDSIETQDCTTITRMLQFCVERIGI